jgi:hypothetical protein
MYIQPFWQQRNWVTQYANQIEMAAWDSDLEVIIVLTGNRRQYFEKSPKGLESIGMPNETNVSLHGSIVSTYI